jgi:DNA-directed RNA polymerase subunit RPC12/RpoP
VRSEAVTVPESAPGRRNGYRCPNCTSTDFKHRSTRQFAYRCAKCTAEFDVPAEEELTMQVFTANYSFRPEALVGCQVTPQAAMHV